MNYESTNRIIQQGLSSLRQVIGILPPQKQQEFLPSLRAIERRYADPDFYLSVIGNFNSGKSTFLNALLGMDLLSINDLPTTAIPTYIRWNRSEVMRECGRTDAGTTNSPFIAARFPDGRRYYLDDLPGNQVQQFQEDTGIRLPMEIGARVDYLTTTNSLAEQLQKVELFFPERPEFKHFCLIDTPGINPGEKTNTVHVLNTQSVLRETSDCAIILYPGMNTMTANTKQFIESNAEHLLGNAVVLLTKMDLIPAREWDKIKTYTEKILKVQFHQKSPLVYLISAWMARECQSGRESSEKARQYAESFSRVTSGIMQILHARRMEIVSQRLLQLMKELTGSIEGVVNTLHFEQKNHEKSLRSHSWESVTKEVEKMQEIFIQNVRDQKKYHLSKIEKIAETHLDDGCDRICDCIDNADNRGSLNRAIESYEKTMTDEQAAAIRQIKDDVLGDIRDNYINPFIQDVEACLREHERYLGAMSPSTVGKRFGQGLNVNVTYSHGNVSFLKANMFKIVLLPFGHLGLAVGSLIDIFRFQSIKSDAKVKVQNEIEQMKKDFVKSIKESLNNYHRGVDAWSKNILNTYQSTYTELYSKAEEGYRVRQAAIQQKLKQYDEAKQKLSVISAQIESENVGF